MPEPKPRNLTITHEPSLVERYFPYVVLAIGIIALLPILFQPHDEVMHLHEFGGIPVLDSGRFKPFDSYARDALFPKAYRHTIPTENDGVIEATPWLMNVMANGLVIPYRYIRIANPAVQEFLGLVGKPNQVVFDIRQIPEAGLKKMFAYFQNPNDKQFNQLDPALQKQLQSVFQQIRDRTSKAIDIEAGLRKQKIQPYDARLFRIENDQVLAMLRLEPRAGLRYSFNEIVNPDSSEYQQFQKKISNLIQKDKRNPKKLTLEDKKALQLAEQIVSFNRLFNLDSLKMVPDSDPEKWQTLAEAMFEELRTGKENPQVTALTNLLYLYAVNKPVQFNEALDKYFAQVHQEYPTASRRLGLELYYNEVSPFSILQYFYLAIFVLLCVSWFGWESEPLRQAALYLGILAVVIQTWGLITRMMIQGRPPVTNLYSSALFIGWGCVILAIVMECYFRNTFALLVGSVLGCITLLFAPYMLEDGKDSMEVLQAVLDTNFWLATHVVCITLGYTTTLVAGTIGLVYVLRSVFTTTMTKELTRTVSQMLYGVLCFATLLSFVGTVLGGIWGDQSWGRFWGWDPKENGAVMIVIWNALILHARWGGMVKERGMAMLAIVGNMIIGWSWAGTNQLGVGLHSYGTNNTLVWGLNMFWISQVIVLGIAMVPRNYWRSNLLPPPYAPTLTPVSPFERGKRGMA